MRQVNVVAAFDLQSGDIRDGIQPRLHLFLRHRPTLIGPHRKHRTVDGGEKGKYLIFGETPSRPSPQPRVESETNSPFDGLHGSFNQTTG